MNISWTTKSLVNAVGFGALLVLIVIAMAQ
jgi:hypothetical protein